MTAQVPVTIRQVAAARVRVAGDKELGRTTPAWIVKLAKTPIPPGAGRRGSTGQDLSAAGR